MSHIDFLGGREQQSIYEACARFVFAGTTERRSPHWSSDQGDARSGEAGLTTPKSREARSNGPMQVECR